MGGWSSTQRRIADSYVNWSSSYARLHKKVVSRYSSLGAPQGRYLRTRNLRRLGKLRTSKKLAEMGRKAKNGRNLLESMGQSVHNYRDDGPPPAKKRKLLPKNGSDRHVVSKSSPLREGSPKRAKVTAPMEDTPVAYPQGSPSEEDIVTVQGKPGSNRGGKRGRGSLLVESLRAAGGAILEKASGMLDNGGHKRVSTVDNEVANGQLQLQENNSMANRKRRLVFSSEHEKVNTAEIVRQKIKSLGDGAEESQATTKETRNSPGVSGSILKSPPASEEEESARKKHGRSVVFDHVDIWEFPRSCNTGGVPYEGGASLGLGWERLNATRVDMKFFDTRRRRRAALCRENYAHVGHKSEEERMKLLGPDVIGLRQVRLERRQMNRLREVRAESAEDIPPQHYVEKLRLEWADPDDEMVDDLLALEEEIEEEIDLENNHSFGVPNLYL